MAYRILFFLALMVFLPASGQEVKPPANIEAVADSLRHGSGVRGDSLLKLSPVTDNPVFGHRFREDFQKKYRGAEYDYSEKMSGESLWQRMLRKISEWLAEILRDGFMTASNPLTKALVYLAIILVVGFVLYFIIRYLLSRNGLWFFRKKKNEANISGEVLHENIHEINFPASIAKFESEGNYRMAVRYQFLLVLKKLTDRQHLVWNPEKTNHDYVRELKSAPLREDFSALSYIFDNVWYGQFEVGRDDYENFRARFNNFNPNPVS